MRRAYARFARTYERRWSRYLDVSTRASLAARDYPAGARLLDLGCGTGILLRRLARTAPRVEAWGLDLSPEMLAVARSQGIASGRLVLGDAASLPFPAGSFDAVVSASSLHHWPDPTATLREIGRVTRPGASLVLTDWCRDFLLFRPLGALLRRFDASVHHVYGGGELQTLVRTAGFRVETLHRYRIAPCWGMMTLLAVRGPS